MYNSVAAAIAAATGLTTDQVNALIAAAVSPKADAASVNAELADKAEKSYVDDQLGAKVDATALNDVYDAIDLKASIAALNALTTTVSGKADSGVMTAALLGKADLSWTQDQVTYLLGLINTNSTAISGKTSPSDVDAKIATANSASDSAGENGWVVGSMVTMSGVNTIDLTGIPAAANEVMVRIQGLSTTAAVNLAAQCLDSSGAVISTNTYYGYTSVSTTSSTAGTAWSGVGFLSLFPSLVAANFESGVLVMRRLTSSGAWSVQGLMMDGTRQCIAIGIKDAMTTFGGIRLNVASGTFDGGTCGLSWRK